MCSLTIEDSSRTYLDTRVHGHAPLQNDNSPHVAICLSVSLPPSLALAGTHALSLSLALARSLALAIPRPLALALVGALLSLFLRQRRQEQRT